MTTTTWSQYYSQAHACNTRWCRTNSLTTEKSLACCIARRANTGILSVTTFVVKRSPHGSACRTSLAASANPPPPPCSDDQLPAEQATSWTTTCRLHPDLARLTSQPTTSHLTSGHLPDPPTFAICQRCVWIFRRFNSWRLPPRARLHLSCLSPTPRQLSAYPLPRSSFSVFPRMHVTGLMLAFSSDLMCTTSWQQGVQFPSLE